MLVLSRHIGERIFIDVGDERITLLVTDIRNGNKVRIGIEAAPHVVILREELDNGAHWERIEERHP